MIDLADYLVDFDSPFTRGLQVLGECGRPCVGFFFQYRGGPFFEAGVRFRR